MKLNITLGHNSSAALFDMNGMCLVAYEEERLSKVKGDSSFPKLAIEKCLSFQHREVLEIRVSHWFNDVPMESKYYLPKYLAARMPNAIIIWDGRTHHDHHAQSGWNFSGTTKGLTVVVDGFGNNEEVISLYRDGTIIHRVKGYENSLGLMFQYATSAMGLKENEDEYKLLGYEIHSKIEPELELMPIHLFDYDYRGPLNVNKLAKVKDYWHMVFKNKSREDVARIAQFNLEYKVVELISSFLNGDELIQLSGGVFYNVKLNNLINRTFDAKVCVNPVCGDQGNVFGYPDLKYTTLCLGHRKINEVYPSLLDDITESFMGHMEFGPRALCNTSTIAMPTMENVETINKYNNRSTVMPMAPVVTREFFNENFLLTDKVLKSEKYMIISFDYKTMKPEWRGGAHYDPIRDVYTGRVQVLDEGDALYSFIADKGGIMINTSLNYHGTPIIYDNLDYIKYHKSIL